MPLRVVVALALLPVCVAAALGGKFMPTYHPRPSIGHVRVDQSSAATTATPPGDVGPLHCFEQPYLRRRDYSSARLVRRSMTPMGRCFSTVSFTCSCSTVAEAVGRLPWTPIAAAWAGLLSIPEVRATRRARVGHT